MASTKMWAREVNSASDDVGAFKEILSSIIDKKELYIIYCPKDIWGTRETAPTLLVLCDAFLDIYFYDEKKEKITKIRHSKNRIFYIEKRKSLLHSWIKLCSLEDGTKIESKIEYSSTLKSLFQPIIDIFRDTTYLESTPIDIDILKFYEGLDYRFKSYIRELKIPLSAIQTMIFQDKITRPYLKIFKRSIAMPHLFIMTDKEWIVISEGETKQNWVAKYEDIYTFFKQNEIEKIELTPFNSDTTISQMTVTFFEESSFSYYLSLIDGYRCTRTIETLTKFII